MEVVGIILLCFLIWFVYTSRKFSNPYKLYMFIGQKGAGKTTHICKMSMKYREQGRPVYTTEYMPDTYHIEYDDIGVVQFPPESVIFIDEVGMLWDNRNFKNFKPHVRDYFKLQRHYKHTIYMYSQFFDVDKKLRDLCDMIFIMECKFNCWSVSKKVIKKLQVIVCNGEGEDKIADRLICVPFFIPGSRKFTYNPKYHRYFDSFAAPELQHKEYELRPKKYFSTYHLKVQLHLMKKQLLQFQRKDEGVFVIICRGFWYGILFVIRKYARAARKILVDKLKSKYA